MDEGLVEALRQDYRTAPITEAERVMLDYTVKITRDATRVSPEDHQHLRATRRRNGGKQQRERKREQRPAARTHSFSLKVSHAVRCATLFLRYSV